MRTAPAPCSPWGWAENAAETARNRAVDAGQDRSDGYNRPQAFESGGDGQCGELDALDVGSPWDQSAPWRHRFYWDHANRPELVYLGADDGMLHAFYASNGKEAFAFIPADMVPMNRQALRAGRPTLQSQRPHLRSVWVAQGEEPVRGQLQSGRQPDLAATLRQGPMIPGARTGGRS